MKPACGPNLRPMQWRFAGLERARSLRLDAARLALAGRRRHASDLQAEIDEKAAMHAREVDAIHAARRLALDPRIHAAGLEHLVKLVGQHQLVQARLVQVQEQVSAARAACAKCDAQLALLRKLRDAALAVQAAEERQRLQKEADLAWLARTQRREPA